MAKTQNIQALVLTDNLVLGVLCGQVLEGPDKMVKALADAGAVDCHPSAVSIALKQGAKVVAVNDPAYADSFSASQKPTVSD